MNAIPDLIPLHDNRPGLRSLLQVQVKEAGASGSGDGGAPTLDFIASTATLDRYHEVIEPAGWRLDAYRKNPVFQNAHNYGDILFTLGKAAIYPAGSWETSLFNEQAKFPMGAFPPPVDKAGDQCYISDHTDIALGMNAKTKNPEAAKKFLEWVATPEFAEIYSNALPGFFTLQNAKIAMKDPLAQEFISWRDKCKSTIRNSYQILSRGTPNLENELWQVSANVINGKQTPEQAAKQIQDGLDSWYKPQ